MSPQEDFPRTHRDSVELARHRLEEHRLDKINYQLASTRDSFLITKTRFERYPKSQKVVDQWTGKVVFGGLSPILDASPPDPRSQAVAVAASFLKAETQRGKMTPEREHCPQSQSCVPFRRGAGRSRSEGHCSDPEIGESGRAACAGREDGLEW